MTPEEEDRLAYQFAYRILTEPDLTEEQIREMSAAVGMNYDEFAVRTRRSFKKMSHEELNAIMTMSLDEIIAKYGKDF